MYIQIIGWRILWKAALQSVTCQLHASVQLQTPYWSCRADVVFGLQESRDHETTSCNFPLPSYSMRSEADCCNPHLPLESNHQMKIAVVCPCPELRSAFIGGVFHNKIQ